MRLKIFICLLLGSITLAIYWPVRHFQMIDLDDPVFINPDAALEMNWHGVEQAMTEVVVANWHPVTNLSFLIMHGFFGINPGAEHLLNVVFHAANAILLFLVLARMTDATWRSAIVTAIFAWHSLRVESVAWIAERKDVLFMFFMLLSLLCYTEYVKGKDGPGRESRMRYLNYFLALFFFALSLMSKAMVVTLPFLLLLLDVWPLERFQGLFGGQGTDRPTLKALLLEKIPFFGLTTIFCIITYWVQGKQGAVMTMKEAGVAGRFENAILSYINYLWQFFWPTKLAVFYPRPSHFDIIQVLLAGLLLLTISALCILQIQRRPYLAAGWFWYLGTMVPVIGLVQVGEQAMADRYTYLPLIGPTISLIWLIAEWVATKAFRRNLAILAAIPLLVLCVFATRRQMAYWESADRLFSRAIAVTPDNFTAQSCLATALENERRYREAVVHFRVALALEPHDFETHYQLAVCLMMAGYEKEGLAEYRAVLSESFSPNDYVAYMHLADALEQLGHTEKAMLPLEAAVRLDPDSTKALNDLAWTLATCQDASVRDGERAVELAERACELTGYKETQTIGTLAAAYAEAGRFDEAVATARKAIASAQQKGETALLKSNEKLLQLYLKHQAYRE